MFYNCCYKGDDIPEDLRKLYDYIETGRAENELTKSIETAVENGRNNKVWRSQYMKERTLVRDAKDEERFETISDML